MQVLQLFKSPYLNHFPRIHLSGMVISRKQGLDMVSGSTTGPTYNEKSPLGGFLSVRPRVMKVSAESVEQWCKGNVFKEDHAHGVRNLVINEKSSRRSNVH